MKQYLSTKYFGHIEPEEIKNDNDNDNKMTTAKCDANSFFARKKIKAIKLIENEISVFASNSNNQILKENGIKIKQIFPYETMPINHNENCENVDRQSLKSGTFGPPMPMDLLSEPSSSNSSKKTKQTKRKSQQKLKKNDFKEKVKSIAESIKTWNKKHLSNREKININTIGEPQHRSKIDLDRILVHSRNNIIPMTSIQEANFTPDVHRALEKCKLQETYVTQAYTW